MRSPSTLESFDELRLALLSAEKSARDMIGDYENRYAQAHLSEVSAFMRLGLAQIEYARLATNNPPDRTLDNPANWTEITVYGDGQRYFRNDVGDIRAEKFEEDDGQTQYWIDENGVVRERSI